ncbi:MAG: choice-of-anchor V domain-containing protein [Acidobacteriota bacterium]|nr:IPT/TIG domain-containing protein [Blastocatellia bacterium]MDW8412505.1 choice-of-anchor V domain-containing protein [Acidobacteriota bacterium]
MLKKFKISVFILGCTAIVLAFSSGPPPSNTGAPGESNCSQCHTGTVNASGGSATISGLPQSYVPGTRYNLTLTISRSDRSRWGFQATALTDDGSAAGTFQSVDGNTQTTTGTVQGKTRNYIQHTSTGTRRGTSGSVTFNFIWIAPSSDVGQVTFYIAANAANNNGASSGDNVYLTTAKVSAPAAAAPSISLINPTKGPSSGGTTVTVTGSNFKNGAIVGFGSKQASTTFVDSSNLVAVSPAGTGTVDITVTNPDGQVARLASAFTYEEAQAPAPILAGIDPTSGPTSGGTTVTLTGNNFAQGAKVIIGKEASVTSVTPTQIKAVTQPNEAGVVDVVVINPDGQSARLAAAFNYIGGGTQPSISLLAPNGGEVLSSGGLPFEIRWTQSLSSTATQKIELSLDSGNTFSTTIASNLKADKTSFEYAVPAGISSERARIRITAIDNGVAYTDTSDADFKILPAPIINNVTATVTSTVKLKVTGSGFVNGSVIEVDGSAVNTKFKSNTTLQAKKLSSSLIGKQIRVRVRNPDGTISLEKLITPQ